MILRGFYQIPLLLLVALGMASCGTAAQIEWVNFIKVHDITYTAAFIGDTALPPALQGSMYAQVRFNVADQVHDPAYQTKDGDAAFLPRGTPIYQVIGYRPTFRLAARWQGQLTIYEAHAVPHAQTGADLLDLQDKVVRMSVLWNTRTPPGTDEHGSFTDPTTVQALVAAIMAAPLRTATTGPTSLQVFIAFHLRDGTETVRAFYPADHDLGGIQVPDAVVRTLQPLLPSPSPVTTPSPHPGNSAA